MSAIAIFRGTDGVILASDGICYDEQGIVLGFTSKVFLLPELDCVIGNIGIGGFSVLLREKMGWTYRDFDDLLEGIVEDVREVHDHFLAVSYPLVRHATVVLAGWSKNRQAFETYRVGTRDKDMVGQDGNITAPAFTLVPLPESWVSSVPNKEDYLQFGLDQNGEGINFFDYAARCVCALRAAGYEKGTGDLDGLPYQVGGFLQMTLMLPDKLSSAIVHRWPDEIGKPVDKSAGDAMPKFPLQF